MSPTKLQLKTKKLFVFCLMKCSGTKFTALNINLPYCDQYEKYYIQYILYSYCDTDFNHITKINRLDSSLVHLKLSLIFSAPLIPVSLNPQLRLHTVLLAMWQIFCQRSSDTGTTTQSTHILEYCVTTALDTETLPLKCGPFSRIIALFLYKWLPVYPLGLFFLFSFSAVRIIIEGLLPWLLGY